MTTQQANPFKHTTSKQEVKTGENGKRMSSHRASK